MVLVVVLVVVVRGRSWTAPERGARVPSVLENAMGVPLPRPLHHWDVEEQVRGAR